MRQLKNTLQQDGIECYVAKHDANYGGLIYTKLSSAIDNSKAVIAILTQKGCASPSVNQELGYAKKAGKRIIPLVDKGVNLPVMLQGLEYKKFDRSSLDHTCIEISELVSRYFPQILDDESEVSDDDVTDVTIVLDNEEYEVYLYDLDKGRKIIGEIKSNVPINVFVVRNYGLKRFENDGEFDYEGGGEKVKRIKINFEIPGRGPWYVIIENEEYDEAEIVVYLKVE